MHPFTRRTCCPLAQGRTYLCKKLDLDAQQHNIMPESFPCAQGRTYLCKKLDLDARVAVVRPAGGRAALWAAPVATLPHGRAALSATPAACCALLCMRVVLRATACMASGVDGPLVSAV